LEHGWTVGTSGTVTSQNACNTPYSGTCSYSAVLSPSGGLVFSVSPAVSNVWTSIQFSVQATAANTMYFGFTGINTLGYFTLPTTWETYYMALSELAAPSTLGSPASLYFTNEGNTTITFYLDNLEFY